MQWKFLKLFYFHFVFPKEKAATRESHVLPFLVSYLSKRRGAPRLYGGVIG